MLDANTGNWILTLTNVPGGETVTTKDGSILRIRYDRNANRYLGWNLSQAIPPAGPVGTEEQQWEPMVGRTINAVNNTIWTEYGPDPDNPRTGWTEDDILPRYGHTINTTAPADLPRGFDVLLDENRVIKQFVHSYVPRNLRWGTDDQTFTIAVVDISKGGAYSPFPDKPATQNWDLGYSTSLKWKKDFTFPLGGNRTWGLGPMSYEEQVFTLWCKEERQWWGYSLADGSMLWGPSEPHSVWEMFSTDGEGRYAYGNLYSSHMGGTLYCNDILTGEEKWTYTAEGIGYESPYGDYTLGRASIAIADNKIFVSTTEHSPTQPLARGSYLRCIDAHTGEEIWKTLNYVDRSIAIADGCIVALNTYDNRMYVYGKGPSATTVSVKSDVIQEGDTMMVTGTVTDQSPGAKGTPAIADEHMDAWMDYLYMKQAMPHDAVGVSVRLTAYDPNGNFQDIGTTTCDANGNFGLSWTPPVPGDYYIRADFDGSGSYGASSDTTYMTVTSAPAATPPPDPTPAPMTDTYVLGMGAAAIIVIIVIGLVLILMMRRK
jgi:hypothetical protein